MQRSASERMKEEERIGENGWNTMWKKAAGEEGKARERGRVGCWIKRNIEAKRTISKSSTFWVNDTNINTFLAFFSVLLFFLRPTKRK